MQHPSSPRRRRTLGTLIVVVAAVLLIGAGVVFALVANDSNDSKASATASVQASLPTAQSVDSAPAAASEPTTSAPSTSAPAPTSSTGVAFGVLDNTDAFQNPQQFWGDYKALRMSAYRVDALWSVIAPTKPANALDPNDPAYQWEYLDTLVRAAGANDATKNLVMTIWRTPQWATKYGGKYATEEALRIKAMPNPKLYAQFVHAVATRYSGTFVPTGSDAPLPAVHKWQIWNEPNTYLVPWKVDGEYVVARNYASLMDAGYDALKAVSKRNVVSNGGFGPSGQGIGPLSPFIFVKRFASFHPKLDVLSVHAYGGYPKLGMRDGAGAGTDEPNLAPGNLKAWIATADRAFHHKYRIWVTEFGWQTAPEDPQIGVSHRAQAADMKAMFQLLRSTGRVDIGIWFLMRDEPQVEGWQSGVRTAAGESKASYETWLKYGH